MNLSKETIDIGIHRGKRIIEGVGHRIPWIEAYQDAFQKYEGNQVLINGLCKHCSQRFKVVHWGSQAIIVYYTDRWNQLCKFDLNERWFSNRTANKKEDQERIRALLKTNVCRRLQVML
jgi:hypothetical protein